MDIDALCKDVPPEIRPEIETLAKAVKALQDKVEGHSRFTTNRLSLKH